MHGAFDNFPLFKILTNRLLDIALHVMANRLKNVAIKWCCNYAVIGTNRFPKVRLRRGYNYHKICNEKQLAMTIYIEVSGKALLAMRCRNKKSP